jgi:hypothetical protein
VPRSAEKSERVSGGQVSRHPGASGRRRPHLLQALSILPSRGHKANRAIMHARNVKLFISKNIISYTDMTNVYIAIKAVHAM